MIINLRVCHAGAQRPQRYLGSERLQVGDQVVLLFHREGRGDAVAVAGVADHPLFEGQLRTVVQVRRAAADAQQRRHVEAVRHHHAVVRVGHAPADAQRAHVLVSQEFFDALVAHKSVKEAYGNYAEAAQRLGGDMRKGFSFGGLTFEEYRGVVDGKRFIDAGEGHAFPVGTSETFSNFGAPADFVETVNTLALPYYARQQNKDFNRGIDLHVQANQLPLVNRPGTIVELVA